MQLLKVVAKASLTSLTAFSFGCSSVGQVYVPVGCLGLPTINVRFTTEEANSIPVSAVDKIKLVSETYKARINAQCEINAEHDKLHEVK